jgi:hypothetical protein
MGSLWTASWNVVLVSNRFNGKLGSDPFSGAVFSSNFQDYFIKRGLNYGFLEPSGSELNLATDSSKNDWYVP